MYTVSYHTSVGNLQTSQIHARNPFARAEWFALLETAGDADALIAIARDGDEWLALPLVQRNRAVEGLANWYSFTWQPIATKRADRQAALQVLARDLRTRCATVTLAPLPDEDGLASDLEHAFASAGWHTVRDCSDTNHYLNLTDNPNYASYLAKLPGTIRTALKRKASKLEVQLITRFDAAMWGAYEAIYAESWKPEEGAPAMLRAFAQQEGAAGRLRMALGSHEGEPVAAQFWTVEAGTAYIHKLAHRQDAHSLSPGTILTAALMEHVIDIDRVAQVDFGTGDDPYKADWMNAERARYRMTCHNPARPRVWPAIVRATLRNLAKGNSAG